MTSTSDNTLGSPSPRTPVYFLSIGGPNSIERSSNPAYTTLESIGHEITARVKPTAILVFSAHWQAGPKSLRINAAERVDLIYDFHGFPKRFYEYEFPSTGSPEIAEKVVNLIEETMTGVKVEKVRRGLDHGVWAGFIAAFNPKKNPLNIPIVQVSLFDNEDTDMHYRLGQALESLRDEGVMIIGAGMAVHNLIDYRRGLADGVTMPYTYSFDEALKDAAAAQPESRRAKLLELMERKDARQAHPTLDHILPFHVAAGAAGSDVGERLWTLPDKSLSWAQYRFGNVPGS